MLVANDGEKIFEKQTFNSIDEAWQYSNDMGSKWIFYSNHFVVTDSMKSIVSTSDNFNKFIGKRVSTLIKEFKHYYAISNNNNNS